MSDQQKIKPINEIRFEGVSYAHEHQDPTLSNADFEFPHDRLIWIKSQEGAGKSTLLQVLAGLLIPQSGKYLLNGDNVCEMTFEEFLPYRLNIGYSFDYGGLINNRTIEDNILLPLVYHDLIPRADAKARVNQLIETFDLGKFRSERPAHVPGRVRKLGCLLRALVIHPEVLLLDDPSVGLGTDTTCVFVDTLLELRKQGHLKHIFVSSYDEKFMKLLEYDIVHLDEGHLHFQPEESKKVASL
jgi:ABC-type ATPase involved in cell division